MFPLIQPCPSQVNSAEKSIDNGVKIKEKRQCRNE